MPDVHGPVQARSGNRTAWARKYAIWNHEIDTLAGISDLNEADSVADAGRAIAKVTWNENAMVADDQGNIGWWHPGRLPLRPKRWDERLPYPGDGSAEWRGLLRVSQRPHVINPAQGWLANWNNAPSVGWTIGDGVDTERLNGNLHRAAFLFRLVAPVAAAPTYDASRASTAWPAPRRSSVRCSTPGCARPRPAPRGRRRPCSTPSWRGTATTTVTDAAGTVDPGVAAWEALKDAAVRTLPKAARGWLGAPGGSHPFDFGGADATAFHRLNAAGLRGAAASAAAALAPGSARPIPLRGASRAGCTT